MEKEKIKRYQRHLLLPEIGMEGQEKICSAKVLVVGAGGLGCPSLQYLSAAGVGTIGIVDFDRVEESNLQRQVLFNNNDIGESKAIRAARKLKAQNPFVEFVVHDLEINTSNALEIISGYDIVVDGTDNFPTRYLVNDACFLLKKPLVYASIYRFEGQVSVFNFRNKKGNCGPDYRCLFPEPPHADEIPDCSQSGVLGVLPGIMGSLQANEVIKIITGIGEVLSGKLLIVDALSMNFFTIQLDAAPGKKIHRPGDAAGFRKYDYELDRACCKNAVRLKNISCEELDLWIRNKEDIQLVDVREPMEEPGPDGWNKINIPLNKISSENGKISRSKKVIIFCRGGARSKRAIELLEEEYGFDNLYNLEGGVMEWKNRKIIHHENKRK